MEETLSSFEKLCLKYIAVNNDKWTIEIYEMINNFKVIERIYGNPVGFYVTFDFINKKRANNQNMPAIIDAWLELPEFQDGILFMLYPATAGNNEIFIEVCSVCIAMDFEYIAQKMRVEMKKLLQ